MTTRKRIGNDIAVKVEVLRNGVAETLTGKTLGVTLWTDRGKFAVECFEVSGNEIRFVWYGSEQKLSGTYCLTLTETYGDRSMNTADSKPFLELTPHSWGLGQHDGCGCGHEHEESDEIAVCVNIKAPVIEPPRQPEPSDPGEGDEDNGNSGGDSGEENPDIPSGGGDCCCDFSPMTDDEIDALMK